MRALFVLVSLLFVLFALAQTSTKCNPLDASCPADKGLTLSTINYNFTHEGSLDDWDTLNGNVHVGSNGAEFTINKQGEHPTIQSGFAIFYGEVSIEMKASPGTGIVSSLMMESDDRDEIDWEVLGGFADKLQTDYFGKGDTSTYDRSTWAAAAAPQSTFHKYTWTWTESQIIWSIDGQPVRTLPYSEAKGGSRFPQTPMYIRIGIWAGGDPSNREGTITWAGGLTDYSQAPFTMYVKSVHISNYNPAKSYSYSDNSGSSKSIKLDGAAPKDQSPSSSESSSSTTSSPSTSSSGTSSSSSTTSSSATSFATTTSSLTHTTSADKSTEGTTTTAGHTSTGTSSQTTLSSITSSDTKQTPSASNQNSSSNHYVSMAPQANHTATDAPASISEGVAMPPIVKPAAAVFDLNDARILLILIFFVALFN